MDDKPTQHHHHTAEAGQVHHEDGSSTLALGSAEPDGNGMKVVSFPEPGGTYNIDHNVPRGTGPGEFSS